MKSIDKVQIVGDDLYVTNLERLKKGFLNISSNAILIKLNQIDQFAELIKNFNGVADNSKNTELATKTKINHEQIDIPCYCPFHLSMHDKCAKFETTRKLADDISRNR